MKSSRLWKRVLVALLVAALLPLVAAPRAEAATLSSTSFTAMDPRTGIAGNRYDWGFTTATTATLSKVTMGVPSGTSGPNKYLDVGTSGTLNYATTSDTPTNSVTGDIDLRVKVAPATWFPASYYTLVNKWTGSTDRAFALNIAPGGIPQMVWSPDGSTQTSLSSSAPVPYSGSELGWLRATFSPSGGGISTAIFYTSSDGVSWSQLGTVRTSTATSIFDNSSNVEVGSWSSGGASLVGSKIYKAEVRNGIDGPVVSSFDPNAKPTGTGLTWLSSIGETWTVTRTGSYPPPADIASDLSAANVVGLPAGKARVRYIDGKAEYTLTTPTSITAGTAVQLGLMGFTNTTTAGSYTSLITSYDNAGTPATVDSATTSGLTFSVPTVETYAGGLPLVNGTVSATSVSAFPSGMNINGSTMYIVDAYTASLLSMDLNTGQVTRVAGDGLTAAGDGPALSSHFNGPDGVAVDSSGNVLVADTTNARVRKLNTGTAVVSTVAGSGASQADGVLPTTASLNAPSDVAADASGNYWVAEVSGNKVRKVDAGTGFITTVAGTGTSGYNGDGTATTAQLNRPTGLALDTGGNLYIADSSNARIRKVDTGGNLTTVAGSVSGGFSGDGAAATSAQLNQPWGIALNSTGDIFIADKNNNRIRKVTVATGFISTIAGTGTAGFSGDGGSATAAQLELPTDVQVDASGNVYFADSGNNRIRKIDTSGNISTVFGSGSATYSASSMNGTAARFFRPRGMAVDSAGNVAVADGTNYSIRGIDQYGNVTTLAGGGPNSGGIGGDGGPATAAKLNTPDSVAYDTSGNLYIGDRFNNRIRKVTPGGTISTLASLGSTVYGVAVHPTTGDVYAATSDCRVLKSTQAGVVTTVAGTASTCSDTGDGGAATSGTLNVPRQLAFNSSGDLYVAEINGVRVRKISTAGIITTVAGGGATDADNIAATSSSIGVIWALTVDAVGDVYVSTNGGTRIRKFRDGGTITTVAGSNTLGWSGDGGAATSALFANVTGLAVSNGYLYVGDYGNSTIRRMQLTAMAPNVNADSLTVAKDTPYKWPIQSNDWDVDGAMDPNSVAVTAAPAHGSVTVNASTVDSVTPTITFTPTASYTGADSFTYQACDSSLLLCKSATVTVTIGSDQLTSVAGGLTEGLATNIAFSTLGMSRFRRYLYIGDGSYNTVRRYDTYTKQLVVVAGSTTRVLSGDGGPATSAGMNGMGYLTTTPNGTVLVAAGNNVRRVTLDGTITTVAGNGTGASFVEGAVATATAIAPISIAQAPDGSVYTASNTQVWKFTIGGTVTRVAGTHVSAAVGENVAATTATFATIRGMVVSAQSDLYIADVHAVRRIRNGTIVTVAGQMNTSGSTGDGGPATSALLNTAKGLSIDSTGAILLGDSGNLKLRRFTDGGTIASVSGASGPSYDVAAGASTDAYVSTGAFNAVRYVSAGGVQSVILNTSGTTSTYAGDGTPALLTQIDRGNAGWGYPVVDATGNIFYGTLGARIRKFDAATGLSSTAAGDGFVANTSTRLGAGVNQATLDAQGRYVFSDSSFGLVRRVNNDGTITTLAGSGSTGNSGDGGPALSANMNPDYLAMDKAGNIYVGSNNYHNIRRIDAVSGIITTYAGDGTANYSGDGGPATAAGLGSFFSGLAADAAGNVYISDKTNNRIRMIDTRGIISSIVGNGTCNFTGDGGPAASATLCNNSGMAVDQAGNLFIADTSNYRIRKVDAATGIISTVIGNGTISYTDNQALPGSISTPRSVWAADNGNVYIMGDVVDRIRMAKGLSATSTNRLSTTAWSVVPGASGHPNLRERFVVTPSSTVTASKLTFTLPAGTTGTPVLTSAYGIPSGGTVSLSGTTLTYSFTPTSLQANVPVALAFEGWTSTGTAGAYAANVTLYDTAGNTAIGWARSNVVNLSAGGATGLTSADAGYGSVWGRSVTATATAPSVISLDPAVTPTASSSAGLVVTTSGNLNANSLTVAASALTNGSAPFSSTADGTAAGAFVANTWGASATSSTGTPVTDFYGLSGTPRTLVTGAQATSTYTATPRARINYLQPAGMYTSTLTWRIVPGS